jgi:predicted DNA-binding ribbon-helix-helix protein
LPASKRKAADGTGSIRDPARAHRSKPTGPTRKKPADARPDVNRPDDSDGATVVPRIRHRIIQHRGKRFSLKLDDLVWSFLDELAIESGMTVNELVAGLADGAASITGTIRTFCLQQALDRIKRLRRGLDDRALIGAGVSIAQIADACPSPCFVVSQDHIIRRTNAAAQSWAGVREAGLVGRSLEHYFQVKAALPLAEIVRRFGTGSMQIFPARILYLRPGRVVAAEANLCPAVVRGPQDLLYLVLVDSGGR